ncbi:MAG: DUF4190 domain-containing protein [Planctomycetota bacterium]|nr:DUF4190 domain-containing protein [Planctomycetota bacterium]
MDDGRPIESTEFRCLQCGYDVSGSAVGGTCPECGKPIGESLRATQKGDRSCGSATAALVLGILSLTVCALLGPIAIFAATSAKKEMAVGGYSRGSHTMAKAGLIMGIISTVLFGLLTLAVILDA